MKKFFWLPFLLIVLCGFYAPHPKKVLVIREWPWGKNYQSGDTIFIQHLNISAGLNDTIKKYCGADTQFVRTIFIGNPGYIIKDLYFQRFPDLRHLILAGDDVSWLDSIHYDFFNCSKLKRITCSSVYMSNGPENRKGYKLVKRFIHGEREDIRVRFKPMGAYNNLGWPE